jgi:hypothetical protein
MHCLIQFNKKLQKRCAVSACDHGYMICTFQPLIAAKWLCVILVGSFSCLCHWRIDILRAQLLSLWE